MPSDPDNRLKLELMALKRVFSFRKHNSDFKKYIVLVMVVTWAVITVGIAYGAAASTPVYGTLTAGIWMMVGRVWSKEAGALLGANERANE